MDSNTFLEPTNENQEQLDLRIAIEATKQELTQIKQDIEGFEVVLRQHLGDYIIEAQELTVLYKQQKKAKKEKRLAQKRKGKNYQEPTGLKAIEKDKAKSDKTDTATHGLKKKLYREAMLQVHPDKFSLSPNEQEAANEITAKLIHIYNYEDLDSLKTFHAEIFSETLGLSLHKNNVQKSTLNKTQILQVTLKQLKVELDALKSSQLYTVIATYENPLHFVDELISYYKDKIAKLKKRTRTKN